MRMIRLLAAEFLKLRRSLVLLVTFAAPACVSAFAALALATRAPGAKWERFLDEGLAMWSFFMLPMSVTALTMLLAQMEHGPRMWRHLLVLPVPPARLFLAKAAMAMLLLTAMQMLVYAGLYLAGLSVEAALPGIQLHGDRQMDEMAVGLAAMAVGAGPMIVIQLGVALYSRSFVLPLVVGILGTFFALVITASGTDLYIPWLLQIYATMWPKERGMIGVTAGLAGLAVALPLMLALLKRRELA
jgi:lantibiotic transport system permease protein